ncbi:hypothetical protein Tco_0085363 [Tanacetum coccineum]
MQVQICRIFLDGYDVLGVRTVIFKYLRLSSRMGAFLLLFTKYSIITAVLIYKRLSLPDVLELKDATACHLKISAITPLA